MTWQPIETAPKDGKQILVFCDHTADPTIDNIETCTLTEYAAHCEALTYRCGKHICVAVWGGEYTETDDWGGYQYTIPDWWFDANSDFEIPVNPTHWMPIPEDPK